MSEYIEMNVNHDIDKTVIPDAGMMLLFLKATIVMGSSSDARKYAEEKMNKHAWVNKYPYGKYG